jgi:hypothetical protein
MANYDDDSRYGEIDDCTYFDTVTEEVVLVLSPQERALALAKVKD